VAGSAQERDPSGLTEVSGVELLSSDSRSKATLDSGELVPVIIVTMDDAVATYDGDIAGLPATSPKTTGKPIKTTDSNVKKYRAHLAKSHDRMAANLDRLTTRADVIGTFDIAISAVSAVVPEGAIGAIAKLPNVHAVFLDELEQIDTEVTPGFIGADDLWNDLGGHSSAGEGVVVGILDTGVWPEHPSYSDPDPGGKGYAPPSTAPGSNGFGSGGPRSTCDFGNTTYNSDDAPFTCNNKLIGAYAFTDTYIAVIGLLPDEFESARDADGHGTHTSSTSAGNGGVAASIFGVNRGTVSGIAPRAHVIMYKVCNDEGCFASDSVRAVEQAILDEVDALNFSIGGGGDPYGDAVSLAFLAAYDAGVLVTPSAGNSGPGADTVSHLEPWTMTVGASTSDRHFISTVSLEADDNDTLDLEGATVTAGIGAATDVVLASDFGDGLCLAPFAGGTFSGEIVICERGAIARVAKSFNVAAGGAGGMLLYNPVLQGLATDNHFIPSVHLENDAGATLLAFMDSHTGVTATFTQGVATAVQGDKMAAFSSRGGPGQTLGISKPDVTAPGVQILAGHTPLPATVIGGLPGQLFQSIQGTSMSAPHAAGAAAIVKAANPDWSPGQIKSALMMSAKTDGVTKEDGTTPADTFDMGSGRILPASAADAGLTISDSAGSFFALEDELWNSNYPSLYVPNLPGIMTVSRTAHDETGKGTNWKLSVDAPSDMTVSVPNTLTLTPNGDKSFNITVDATSVPLGATRHATLYLTSQNQTLHFPITIVRGELGDVPVSLDKTCDASDLERGDTTDCTITAENLIFEDASVLITDDLPKQLKLDSSSLVGGSVVGDVITFNGSLFGATPPAPDVVVDPLASPFGYVPLSLFGSLDIGATDESIANFNVPSFDYAGENYSTIGIVSNGYIVVGGGTGADVNFINSDLPDAAIPNNTLAPFWTDLNPAFGGRVLINVLSNGPDTWTVVEWESVENFGDGETNTAQVWIGTNTDTNPGEDISFVYGADVSDGDGGFLTVGVENKFGNEGGTVYFDGAGTPPAPSFPNANPGYEVDVFSVPGAPGETHTISYTAEAKNKGAWTNSALMTSDAFQGINVASFSGNVTK
jgi:subtilisin family serine protease